MGEFIFETIRTVKLDVIVARNAGEKNGVRARVDGNYHVDVASRNGRNIAVSVDAANEDIERVFSDIDIAIDGVNFGFDFDGIKNAESLHVETSDDFGKNICE